MKGSELINRGITRDADGCRIDPEELYFEDCEGWCVLPPWRGGRQR